MSQSIQSTIPHIITCFHGITSLVFFLPHPTAPCPQHCSLCVLPTCCTMAGELPLPSTEPATIAPSDVAAPGVQTSVTNPDAATAPDSNLADDDCATSEE